MRNLDVANIRGVVFHIGGVPTLPMWKTGARCSTTQQDGGWQAAGSHKLPYEGRALDVTKRLGNFDTLKSAIDKAVNAAVATPKKNRSELTSPELDSLLSSLPVIVGTVEKALL